eukprot:Phypoly_transcript_04891.p1 GENE.Phypoly_transcript_04891~~Phypoly_transcript_04891.p1  ORF type:complete len:632 (+),score=102.08 Phypoly_transcript_04891:99-1994(+)
MYFWETSILGNECKTEKNSDKTYVVYKLVVQDSSQSWTVERRYNDFYALHTRLKEKFSESQLPPVPPKGFQIFTNTDPAFLRDRSMALEKYLRSLLKKDSPTCQCGEVLDFLDPNKKSSLNSSLPIAPPAPKYKIEQLPSCPPRLFVLNQESIFLADGEECFLPQFFDHIDESIKYLVQVDHRINAALSAQSKMHIYEVEKERISATISTLTDQQKVANQIIETVMAPPALTTHNNPHNYNSSNYNNYNDYNIYNNNYTNNNNNSRPNPHGPPPPYPGYAQPNGYRPPPPPYYGPPHPQQPGSYYVVVQGTTPSAPSMGGAPPSPHMPTSPRSPPPPHPHFNQQIPRPSEGAGILVNYLETCLKHIQDAIIWESGLESGILSECVDSNGWCEILERLKWFDAECERLIVNTLGVIMDKDAKKELKKKIRSLRNQASKYLEELTENSKHKCGLPPNPEFDHVADARLKMKKTVEFINENKKRYSGSTAEDVVANYESKMFKLLEDIANLENGKYTTSEERKEYRDKSSDIHKSISSLMKKASDFRVELQGEMTKLQGSIRDGKSNLPDESSLHSLLNRLEDLQANLADLSHDFSKALEIATARGVVGGLVLEKQLEDARKAHEQNNNDMFEL